MKKILKFRSMKLILGTANFNINYGKNNVKFNIKDLKNLSKFCDKKISFFDTASAYNNHKKISNISGNLKIFSKFPLIKQLPNCVDYLIFDSLRQLKLLKINSFYGIMFHSSSDIKILGKLGVAELKKKIKKNNISNLLGVSVYDPEELKTILKIFKPDFIQFPLNIFDRRFLKYNLLKKLKKLNIKLISRSCFLQGQLLNNRNIFRGRDMRIYKKFSAWCTLNKISPMKGCIFFINSIPLIDFLVIGIDNFNQLKEIYKTTKVKHFLDIPNFGNVSKKCINPRAW